MTHPPLIVGIGGTTRHGSMSETALGHALEACARRGVETLKIGGPDLPTEPYDPARPERGDKARALVEACRRADGLILSSPSYHGGISGLIKNAIDYVEDLRDDVRPYFDHRAVGIIISAAGPQALGSTMISLRSVVHALRGWPTPYAALINASDTPFDPAGAIADPAVADALDLVADQVVGFATMMRAARAEV